jgi:hypothetical protein
MGDGTPRRPPTPTASLGRFGPSNPGGVRSTQQENVQAAFDGANNGLRKLLNDATDAGFSRAELVEIAGLSPNVLDEIL